MEQREVVDLEDGWAELWIEKKEKEKPQDVRVDLLEINKMLCAE